MFKYRKKILVLLVLFLILPSQATFGHKNYTLPGLESFRFWNGDNSQYEWNFVDQTLGYPYKPGKYYDFESKLNQSLADMFVTLYPDQTFNLKSIQITDACPAEVGFLVTGIVMNDKMHLDEYGDNLDKLVGTPYFFCLL